MRGGVVGGGVEIDGEFGEVFDSDELGVGVEERAGAFFAGECGEGGEMLAEEERGCGIAAVVMRGDDAAAGGALTLDEARDDVGGERGLVAEGDERGVERAGELLQHRDAGADG